MVLRITSERFKRFLCKFCFITLLRKTRKWVRPFGGCLSVKKATNFNKASQSICLPLPCWAFSEPICLLSVGWLSYSVRGPNGIDTTKPLALLKQTGDYGKNTKSGSNQIKRGSLSNAFHHWFHLKFVKRSHTQSMVFNQSSNFFVRQRSLVLPWVVRLSTRIVLFHYHVEIILLYEGRSFVVHHIVC